MFVVVAAVFLAGWSLFDRLRTRKQQQQQRRVGLLQEKEPSLLGQDLWKNGSNGGDIRHLRLRFARMIERTGLDLDPSLALAMMLFAGVILATAILIWR